MKFCILMASPRKNGNTAMMLEAFLRPLADAHANVTTFHLFDMRIESCIACRRCQNDHTIFGCVHNDDMQKIFDAVLATDVLVLATPIYSWYCTAPMKAALDRLMYGMNKFYGDEKGPSLWKGKSCAILTTCGYAPDKGADLFAEGVRRYCKHSQLRYAGMCAARDMGYKTEFYSEEKMELARSFAMELLSP